MAARYHRPASLAEAGALFAACKDPRYLAGGHTLIPTIKLRLASPSDLVDISRLPELKGIAGEGRAISIGAGETHFAIGQSPLVNGAIPALAEMAWGIGDPAVRYWGTVGGSVANNDPAADYPAALVALGANVRTDRRVLPAEEFFAGLFSTALEVGEIVTAVVMPRPARAAYRKVRNPASHYPVAGAFVAEMPDGAIRVAVTGAGKDGVFRWTEAEAALAAGGLSPAAIASLSIDRDRMLADIHAPSDYRAHLTRVITMRAVAALAGSAA